MPGLKVFGTEFLKGEVSVQGSKNAALPILAAAILLKGTSVIRECPRISDIYITVEILKYLGCGVDWSGNTITVNAERIRTSCIPEELLSKMRSSITFLGPLLARTGEAVMHYPGGCSIGERPIDLHIYAMERMNTVVNDTDRVITATTVGLKGRDIYFPFPSVGATQNAVMAAVLADGVTNLYNCAKEPEVHMLIDFLRSMGADIKYDNIKITVRGVRELHDCEYIICGDRIVASTYMTALAGVGGNIILKNVNPGFQMAFLKELKNTGCCITTDSSGIKVSKKKKKINAVPHIVTAPYPGFPTDMQSQMAALLTRADGISRITENIFENRFKAAKQLKKMGADISICDGKTLVVKGVKSLNGAEVLAEDLRGSAALVIAGLMAEGETSIDTDKYLNRGYEDIVRDLRELGARIMYDAQEEYITG